MEAIINHRPEHLLLLESICWQLDDLTQLSDEEILGIYDGVLADLSDEEIVFLKTLAKAKQSWLINAI